MQMNPQDRLMDLLLEHNFDLVRHRKHKIYRNPDGLTFVTSSTPSDRRAPQNAISALKRILRQADTMYESSTVIDPAPVVEELHMIKPVSLNEPSPMIEPKAESISDQQWETFKRQCWRDEKLRAKNEKFLSMVSMYTDRAHELLRTEEGTNLGSLTHVVKQILSNCLYKSKVLLYNCKFFDQGIVMASLPDVPILWANNGHIGISAFLSVNTYVQHGTSRLATLRFDADGTPLLFELPDKEARRFYVPPGDQPRV